MHALTLARKRLQARIQQNSTPRSVRLAHDLLENGQSRFLPILSSALAQDILARGYDAATLERVYANRPTGDMGVVGKVADRVMLDLPVHQALRERLDATVGEICAAAYLAVRAGADEFRMLSAPCGLGCELVGMAERLKSLRPEVFAKVRCWGVDPDPQGTTLPEATRRTRAAGLKAQFIREDLRRRREVSATVEREGPFHLISCVGISQQASPAELAEQVKYYAGLLAPGGTLLIDRWQPGEDARIVEGLGIQLQQHPSNEFRAALHAAGLTIEREHATGEGGCTLTVARKVQ